MARRTSRLPAARLGLLVLLGVLVALGIGALPAFAQDPTPTPLPPPTPVVGEGQGPEIPHTLIGRAHCLICHEEGFRGASKVPEDHAGYTNEECLDCHEPTVAPVPTPVFSLEPGAVPTPLAHPSGGGENTCYDCHLLLDEKHEKISRDWKESVHGKADVGCADCHGGDPGTDEMNDSMNPKVGFLGAPLRIMVPGICGGCHADVERMRPYGLPTDQYSKYIESVHGAKLREGDVQVAVCTDCHGVHDIRKASDPDSPVYPLNIPETCARCHADEERMAPYGIHTDQYDLYVESVHGKALLEKQDLRAANCASCHGSHAAKPPTSEEVINVCGKCHASTEDYYNESRHAELEVGPRCWTCHGTHDIQPPGTDMFFHETPPEQACGTCHLDNENLRLNEDLFLSPEDRRCDTCHHEGSMAMAQVEALYEALQEANQAYAEAEEAIEEARRAGMIVLDAEGKLTAARTSLIQAQAVLHTTKLPRVRELTDKAVAASEEAKALAEAKLRENLFRRQAMVIVVAVLFLNVGVLYVIKREVTR